MIPEEGTALGQSRKDRVQADVAMLLQGSFETHRGDHIVHPVQVRRISNSVAEALTNEALPAFDDVKAKSMKPMSHSLGQFTCCTESDLTDVADEMYIEDIYDILAELQDVYDLETCLFCERDGHGERLFFVNQEGVDLWRSSLKMVVPRITGLLALRDSPTIIHDLSKDSRFNGDETGRGMLDRFYMQMPVGLDRDGTYIGTLNLVGRHARHEISLNDCETLERKAREIVSIIGSRCARRQSH